MIKLFNKNMALQALLILVVTGLFWGQALANPQPLPDGDGVLYHLLHQALSSVPLIAVILAMILVLTEGVLLNLILAGANLVPQTSLLPTLLYIIAASATATTITPIILVNIILIACLNRLMLHGTALSIPTQRICNISALIGLASMISLPATVFLLTYLLVAVNYRLYSWRDWAALLLGFMAPYITLVVILAFTGNIEQWWQQTINGLLSAGITVNSTSALKVIADIVLILIMILALFSLIGRLSEKTVILQKNMTTVMLFVVGGIAMLFYQQTIPIEPANFAIPFALCGTILMLPTRPTITLSRKKKRTWINDTLLILTILSALLC